MSSERSRISSPPFPRSFSSSHVSKISPPGPMSIPNAARPSPPPPLPPPRLIDDVTTLDRHSPSSAPASWIDASRGDADRHSRSSPSAIRFGSSLQSGQHRPPSKLYTGPQRNVDFGRPSPLSPSAFSDTRAHVDDNSKVPDISALLEYNNLQGEKQLGQRNLERNAIAYDQSILSRIGGPHGSPRSANPLQTTFAGEPLSSPKDSSNRLPSHSLRPLSMPERRPSAYNQPKWSASSLTSPGFSVLQSPLSEHGFDRSNHQRTGSSSNIHGTGTGTSTPLHRDSVDHNIFGDSETAEDTGMHELNLQDRSPSHSESGQKTGQKRRANSPPGDSNTDPSLRNANGTDPNWQRHANVTKVQQGSYSSTNSGPQPSSYASSFGLSNASTATSYSSEHPSGQFPEAIKNGQQVQQGPIYGQSQYMPPPQQTNRAPPIPHRRTTSSGMPRPPGLWICECCPKKPKKFESEDELRIHEMEKQYVCQYCHNRFKNKNEAERHQNSLHLRRHSWSCAALTSFEDAFHPSMPHPLSIQGRNAAFSGPEADACGYCGIEFPNPPEWTTRIEHLNRVHKFGECNQGKKFFRADHFRQHLKHSHAGTSGKWTNLLENACMKDEPTPQPLGGQIGSPSILNMTTESGQMPNVPSPGINKSNEAIMQAGIAKRTDEMMRES